MTRSSGAKTREAARSSASSGGRLATRACAGLAEPDNAAAEQPAAYLGQPRPDVVVPADQPRTRPDRASTRSGAAASAPGRAQGLGQGADVGRSELHVRVHVDPREARGGPVTGQQGLALGGHRDGQHPDRRARTRPAIRAVSSVQPLATTITSSPPGPRRRPAGRAAARPPGPRCARGRQHSPCRASMPVPANFPHHGLAAA